MEAEQRQVDFFNRHGSVSVCLVVRGAAVGDLDVGSTAAVDELGRLSGVAQLLTGPITTVQKVVASDHSLVLFRHEGGGQFLGFLKYATKDLYFYRKNGSLVQASPTCVLDFYVSEELQRQGVGLLLFQRMLQECPDLAPHKIAYDRPSPKLLAFMKKHFGLAQPDLQPNRFCLFEGFLEEG